jgi:hypothetical protein
MDKLCPIKIRCDEWEEILILRPIASAENPWGVLECLKDTEWGSQIVVVPGNILSEALHGRAFPLLKLLGNPPRIRAKKISKEAGLCSLFVSRACGFGTINCRPGVGLPICYEAPGTIEVSLRATAVAQAWNENRYVIVVEGDEFSY